MDSNKKSGLIKQNIKQRILVNHSPLKGAYSVKEISREKPVFTSAPTGRGSVNTAEINNIKVPKPENMVDSKHNGQQKAVHAARQNLEQRLTEQAKSHETYFTPKSLTVESVMFSHTKNPSSSSSKDNIRETKLDNHDIKNSKAKDNNVKYTMFRKMSETSKNRKSQKSEKIAQKAKDNFAYDSFARKDKPQKSSEREYRDTKKEFRKYVQFNTMHRETSAYRQFAFTADEARKRKAEKALQGGKDIVEFGKNVSQGIKSLEGTIASDGSTNDVAVAAQVGATFAYKSYNSVVSMNAEHTAALREKLTKQYKISDHAKAKYQNTFRKVESTRFKLINSTEGISDTAVGKLNANFEKLTAKAGKQLTAYNKKIDKAQKTAVLLKKKQDTYRKSRFVRTNTKLAQATGTLAKIGGGVAFVLNAMKSAGTFIVPEGSSFLMIAAGGVFMLIILLIIALVIVAMAFLYPFQAIGQWIEGIFVSTPVDYPGQAIVFYLNEEQSLADEVNAAVSEYTSNDGSDPLEAPLDPDMADAYANASNLDWWNQIEYENAVASGSDIYYYTDPITGENVTANTADGAPTFDDSSFRIPWDEPNEDGVYEMSLATHGLPNVPPSYEGVRWLGSNPGWNFAYDPSNEGVTDAKSVNLTDEFKMQMLSTLCADRGLKEAEDELDTDEVKNFFNALPIWQFNAFSETRSCIGEDCCSYQWKEIISHSYSYENEDGETVSGASYETVIHTETFCAGHIFDVLDIQLDSDPMQKIPDEFYNLDRVWEKEWNTLREGETEAEAAKRMKDGEKYYKDILKQMKKDVEKHGDEPLPPLPREDEDS